MLLSRDQFREAVFRRDGNRCVVCKNAAQDAHHILERRLFFDGGYYLDNGSSLCGVHHIAAEQTVLSCDEIREAAGIKRVVLPEHFYPDQPYDKWGNPILPNGQRIKGELFLDKSVQQILAPVLTQFTDRVKYARTYHLPWSQGVSDDDRKMESLEAFVGKQVIVTVKMDGENTTMYRDYIHARSIEYKPHPTRSMIKAIHARIAHDIPEGWRVCGENLYAKHSILYKGLPGYLMVFSVWNEKNECLSWEETKEWAALLDFPMVPVLYAGVWDEEKVRNLYRPEFGGNECEGYVVRLAESFHYRDFRKAVGKYVRESHVRTHAHWMNQRIEVNQVIQP